MTTNTQKTEKITWESPEVRRFVRPQSEKNVEQRKLKVKFKSLSSEQKDIRLEEQREKWKQRAARGRIKAQKAAAAAQNQTYSGPNEDSVITDTSSLHLHRMWLRGMIRSTHLARNFLRGTPYSEVEPFSWTQPDWNHVQYLVEKYSGEPSGVVLQRFAEWMQEGLNGVAPYLVDRDTRQSSSVANVLNEWTLSRKLSEQKFPNIKMANTRGS